MPLPHGSIDCSLNLAHDHTQPDDSVAVAPRRAACDCFGISLRCPPRQLHRPRSNSVAALTVASDRLARHLPQDPRAQTLAASPPTSEVAGKPALARELTGTSPVSDAGSPLPEHAWLITLPRPDGTTAYLLFVAPQADFAILQPLYDSMLLSFKPQ